MKYRVFLTLSNDSEIRVDILANSKEDAALLASTNEKVLSEINKFGSSIKDVSVTQLNNRFEYRPILDMESGKTIIRVTDNKYGSVIEFESGNYNGTSKCVKKPNCTDVSEAATSMREISEYVATYHRRDCFPGESMSECMARMLSNAMNRANITAKKLSEDSGVMRGHIIGTLNGTHPIRAVELMQLCEAMGAEIKIVFPEDE